VDQLRDVPQNDSTASSTHHMITLPSSGKITGAGEAFPKKRSRSTDHMGNRNAKKMSKQTVTKKYISKYKLIKSAISSKFHIDHFKQCFTNSLDCVDSSHHEIKNDKHDKATVEVDDLLTYHKWSGASVHKNIDSVGNIPNQNSDDGDIISIDENGDNFQL
jgi:hypothetical protein